MKKMLRFYVSLKLTAQVPKHDTLLTQVCGLYYLIMYICAYHSHEAGIFATLRFYKIDMSRKPF
jgi:hypothetical protein